MFADAVAEKRAVFMQRDHAFKKVTGVYRAGAILQLNISSHVVFLTALK